MIKRVRTVLAQKTVCLLIGLVSMSMSAQPTTVLSVYDQAASPEGNRPTFEISVIKPNPSGETWQKSNISGDRLSLENVTVRSLIGKAWELAEINLVTGGPAWIDGQRYDVEAKMSESQYRLFQNLNSKEQEHQIDLMLQSLLVDRFHLTIDISSSEVTSLVLAVAKGGPKLQIAGTTRTTNSDNLSANTGPGVTFTSLDTPLSNLVSFLAKVFRRPVIDETGLTGHFDIRSLVIPYDPHSDGPTADAVFALQEQLGLTIKSKKNPTEIVKVGHVERPTDN